MPTFYNLIIEKLQKHRMILSRHANYLYKWLAHLNLTFLLLPCLFCFCEILKYVPAHNTSNKFWDQFPSHHYQCCFQVSETVSWHSSNMLQYLVGRRDLTHFCKVDHFIVFGNFLGIDLISMIYVRYDCNILSFDALARLDSNYMEVGRSTYWKQVG